MKTFLKTFINLSCVILFNLFFFISNAQSNKQEICNKIKKMADKDQFWRIKTVNSTNDSIKKHSNKQFLKIDSINLIEIKHMQNKFGFIDPNQFGIDCYSDFQILVQHADGDYLFQKKYLIQLKKRMGTNIKLQKDYAYLKDRVLVNQEKKQYFGTQGYVENFNGERKWKPKAILHKNKVDKRRAKFGLTPIAFYIENMN